MSTRICPTLRMLFGPLAIALLLGNADDGGCLGAAEPEVPRDREQLCAESGGTWGTPMNWPTPCGQDPATSKGAPTGLGEMACVCSDAQPNWVDGVGCRKCDVGGHCTGYAATCDLFDAHKIGGGVNWHSLCAQHRGCSFNDLIGLCGGNPAACETLFTRAECQGQKGCSWSS